MSILKDSPVNKILVVGAQSSYAIENHYITYLKKMGFEVRTFFAQNYFLDFYKKNILNKIVYRSGLSLILNKINKNLIQVFDEIKPDVVLIFKGMEVMESTLLYFKANNSKLINYNPDHPFVFHSRGSGNNNVKKGIRHYDIYATYSNVIKAELQETYNLHSYWLPFGFELNKNKFKEFGNEKEIDEICFVGAPDKERTAFIKTIVESELPMNVYGPLWHKWLKPSKYLRIHNAVYNDDLWRVLRKYRVQLNLLRPHNRNSHNMRSFEVPAVGGIMLAPRTDEHLKFFEEDKEAFYFQNQNECITRLRYLLKMNTNDIGIVRENARNRSIKSKYTYQNRTAQLITLLSNTHPTSQL